MDRASHANPVTWQMEQRTDSAEENAADPDSRLNEVMACFDTLIGRRV